MAGIYQFVIIKEKSTSVHTVLLAETLTTSIFSMKQCAYTVLTYATDGLGDFIEFDLKILLIISGIFGKDNSLGPFSLYRH